MIPYADALRCVLAHCGIVEAERCAPADAAERVLAENLHAACALPLFDNAAMDGYALASAGSALPAGSEYTLAGAIAAGDPLRVDRGAQAWMVMTGAALPAGFDSVAALERTELAGDARVRLRETLSPGQNVRRRGSDIAPEERIAIAGQRIDPALRMAIAALGIRELQVRRKPRVAILSTGRELVADARSPLGEGQIHGANAPYLEASLRAIGAEVVMNLTLGDEPETFTAQLKRAAKQADLILSTGAVSMGQHDFVPESLRAMGAQLLFHKAAIRPGKPLLAALLPEGPLCIGLPGNPMAAAVGFRFFAIPALRAMLGMPPETPLLARLSAPTHGRIGLRTFLKARLRHDAESGLHLTVLEGQESYRIGSLLQANAWAIVDEDAGRLPAGAWVEALPRDATGGWRLD